MLVERWILTILNRQLSTLTPGLDGLNDLKRDLLIALDEYHNIALTHGSAQDIVRGAREKMGTEELYQGVMQKLSVLDGLIQAEESHQRTQRDRLLRAGIAVITVLLGLPAASQVAGVVAGWDTVEASSYGGSTAQIFNTIVGVTQAHLTAVTIALYVASLCVVLPLVAWNLLPSRNRRRIISTDESAPAFVEGFTWHKGFAWHDKPLDTDEQDTNDSLHPDQPSG